jgi:hypothetical protein
MMKLVILDFSGVLSLDTVLFGREDNLAAELSRSGLAGLGAGAPETFWSELVLPAWEEGSLTARGYKKVLTERLRDFLKSRGRFVPDGPLREAVSAFVWSYFRHSPIDSVWGDIFARLAAAGDNFTLIATDNYAEATANIMARLAAWGFSSRSLGGAAVSAPENREIPFIWPRIEKGSGGCFFAANSADIGFYKADARFWETVRASLKKIFPRDSWASIRLVDDFGFNENAADAYGGMFKAFARREKTTASIEKVFGVRPEAFSFFIAPEAQDSGGAVLREKYKILAGRAAAFILA